MQLSFTELPEDYAIIRCAADAPIPDWWDGAGLTSLTRANDELSLICRAERVPAGQVSEAGWMALRVDTLAELDEPGVVMAAITPISSAGLGVFVISTHLRDYLLVRKSERDKVRTILINAGHAFD